MKNIKISLIAAIGKNKELGKNNKLLWHIPEDLKRFKKLTKGHVVIMGQNTFESLDKPLPNRINIILSKNPNYKVKNAFVCYSLNEAIKLAKEKTTFEEIFIIGGAQVYSQTIKFADKLYLTLVKGSFDADVFFPDYSEFKKVIYKKKCQSDGFKCTFLELIKK